jgi:hypothetical protein
MPSRDMRIFSGSILFSQLAVLLLLSPALKAGDMVPEIISRRLGDVQHRTAFISGRIAEEYQKKYGTPVSSRMIEYFHKKHNRALHGAYRDKNSEGVLGLLVTHRVRTKNQTFYLELDSQFRVTYCEVLFFNEPKEYQASKRWIDLLLGKREGFGRNSIPNISGATLTARSMTQAVTEMLFLLPRTTRLN